MVLSSFFLLPGPPPGRMRRRDGPRCGCRGGASSTASPDKPERRSFEMELLPSDRSGRFPPDAHSFRWPSLSSTLRRPFDASSSAVAQEVRTPSSTGPGRTVPSGCLLRRFLGSSSGDFSSLSCASRDCNSGGLNLSGPSQHKTPAISRQPLRYQYQKRGPSWRLRHHDLPRTAISHDVTGDTK